MRLMALLMVFTAALFAQKPAPTPTPAPAAPVLTAEQRAEVRKLQLDDQRAETAIKQRQLEIVNIQQQQQLNAQRFQAYVADLCKDPDSKYRFDMSSDDLRCVAKPTPAPTAANPKPTPEKK